LAKSTTMTSTSDPSASPPNAGAEPDFEAPWDTEDAEEDGPFVTYPEAPESLIETWNSRRRRMSFAEGEGLPPSDMALGPLLAARIPAGEPEPVGPVSLHGQKLHSIRKELAGKPELAALNAILIAHLRKQGYPKTAPILFRRIWAEAGTELAPVLPGRWLISSIITFGDHGETEAQRRIGLGMNVLFSVMKLYEFERLFSGSLPTEAFPIRSVGGKRLPLDMPKFSLMDGGLDINLLAQLWQEAEAEPVAGRLACHLLQRLNADDGNIFRRIALMRATKQVGKLGKGL
jgi:hypothetical protein